LHGVEDQGEVHYKMAVNEFDVVLGYIEKYNFFTQKMDCYSKDRVLILAGLSAGFGFSTESILKAKCRVQIN
jgi:hypothetical protein